MYRISDIETAILGLLCEGFRYGYELEKAIQERGMRNWTEIGFSSIYYVLKRLEKERIITSKKEEVSGKPARRVYQVTEKGTRAMKEKLQNLLSVRRKPISPLDLGMAYMDMLEPPELLLALESYRQGCQGRIDFLEESISRHREQGSQFKVLALFFRPLAHERTELAWTEALIKAIGEQQGGR